MKASGSSGAQKAFVPKQGEEGTPVAEICRKAGISPATVSAGAIIGHGSGGIALLRPA